MKIRLKACVLAVSTALALGVCAAAGAQISNDTVKIGIITDLSGVYVDIDGPDRGALERIPAAEEHAVDVAFHVHRQGICGVGDKLGMAVGGGAVERAELLPAVRHMPRSLVLGTFERSVAAPM